MTKPFKITNARETPKQIITMTEKIAYIWYPTADMKRAVEFYQDLPGFRLLFRREDWSEFDVGGQRLALKKVDSFSTSEHREGPGVSFLAQPIEKTINALTQQGVRFTDTLRHYPYGKIIHFQDPDGNILGLYEPPPSDKGK